MQMDVKVKICGITRPEDAKGAVEAGADLIGLMFFKGSPRRITLAAARDIVSVLPPEILRVGVFVDPEPTEVVAAITLCGLQILQFHGSETSAFCRQFGVMSMKAIRVKDAASLQELSAYQTDAFLLDAFVPGKEGGTGEQFNWELALAAKNSGRPIFIAGGLTAENVGEAIRIAQPFGVDVSSGVEEWPGRKDAQKMKDFVAAVRAA
jgi:phosphoribosylanthranilate isomerase